MEIEKVNLKEESRRVNLSRALVRVKGPCDLCEDGPDHNIQGNVLVLGFIARGGIHEEVMLCPLHEGFLLQKLLKSYVKRMQCGPKAIKRKMGFIGEIPKLTLEETDGNIPSVGEKILERQRLLLSGGKVQGESE